MKITKERLRELIKEELAELEQEARTVFDPRGDIYGHSRERETPSRASSEQESSDKVSNMFHSLVSPIIWQGRTNEPNSDWIKQLVDKTTKGMKPDQIQAVIEKVENLKNDNLEKVKSELVPLFNTTVDALKSTLQQKIQPVLQAPLKMDESKIKITFRKK